MVRDAEVLPTPLRCTFSLQASEPGTFEETISVSDAGRFEFGTVRERDLGFVSSGLIRYRVRW